MTLPEKKLDEILKMLTSFNDRIRNVENDVRMLKESILLSKEETETIRSQAEKIRTIRMETVGTLTPAEKKIYDLFEKIWTKEGEVVLSRIQDETNLDYKTIAGYANRFVRYGILERHWDGRINRYSVSNSQKEER